MFPKYKNPTLFFHMESKNKNTKQEKFFNTRQASNRQPTPCALYPAATGTQEAQDRGVKGPASDPGSDYTQCL